MRVSIHQPSYFPWLGLLAKIARSECYVALDSVAANRESYQYRNIFWCNGEAKYLTLPVDYHVGKRICDLRFRSERWFDDHLNKLRNYYRHAPHFDEVFPSIEPMYASSTEAATDFLLATMEYCFRVVGIAPRVVRSSTLDVEGARGELVLNVCKAVGATTYISGMGAADYMQPMIPAFDASGIAVEWHTFMHPTYRQAGAFPFVSGLASLDLFFFHGFQNAQTIFQSLIHQDT